MIVSPDRFLPAKPFQFGLRTLFVGIALLGVLLAIMVHLEPIWSLALVWSLLLVAAHVAGNVWGTRSSARVAVVIRVGRAGPRRGERGHRICAGHACSR